MAQEKKNQLEDVQEYGNSTEVPKIFKLNDDCMLHILSLLKIKERLRIQRVCKKWQALINLPWSDIYELEINFSWETKYHNIKFTLPILKQILKHCGSSLTNLKLTSNYKGKGLNKSAIKLLINKCPNVQSLNTTNLYITREMMESIADFRGLTCFTIGKCLENCDEEVSKIFLANQKLRSVEFRECWSLTSNCLSTIPMNIGHIVFGRNSSFEVEAVFSLLPKLKNLRGLSIGNERLQSSLNELLLTLAVKSDFEQLHLTTPLPIRYSNLRHPPLRNLSLFVNLRKMTLMGSKILYDEQLSIIGQHCKKLTSLKLTSSAKVTDRGMRDLCKFLNLEEIGLIGLHEITNKSLSYIQMSSLEVFLCSSCSRLNNKGFRSLMIGSENLEDLILFGQDAVCLKKLISDAKVHTENRKSEKMLTIMYRTEFSWDTRRYEVSSRLRVH